MRVAASVKQPGRSQAPSAGTAPLHPLQGERQIRASSAEIGEGSAGQPMSHTTNTPAHPIPGDSLLTLALEGVGRVRVAATPSTHAQAAATHPTLTARLNPSPGGEAASGVPAGMR